MEATDMAHLLSCDRTLMSSVTSHSDGDVLINMMGIHPMTWSCLALLEQFIQPAAGSLLCLGVFLRFSEGKSS